MPVYPGACRCGRVAVRLVSEREPAGFQPRSDAQTCRFCSQHDGVWISDPAGRLEIRSADPTRIGRCGSGLVEFHFCHDCDDLVYATFPDPAHDRSVGVVRLAVFESIRTAAQPVVATNFEGESLESARARRLASWTPVVRT